MEMFINKFTALAVVIGFVIGYLINLRRSLEFEKTMEARVVASDKVKENSLLVLTPEKMMGKLSAMKSYYEAQISLLNACLAEAMANCDKNGQELHALSYQEEAAFLKTQIEDLRARDRVLVLSIELLSRKPFEEYMVNQQIRMFTAARTVAKYKYESAHRGVYGSVAAYMNAQAAAKVDAEKQKRNKR